VRKDAYMSFNSWSKINPYSLKVAFLHITLQALRAGISALLLTNLYQRFALTRLQNTSDRHSANWRLLLCELQGLEFGLGQNKTVPLGQGTTLQARTSVAKQGGM